MDKGADTDLVQALNSIAAAIANAPPTPVWNIPTYTNSWTSYGAGFAPARYMKVGNIVFVSGLVRSGTIGLPVFTLPVGYRPAYSVSTASQANNVFSLLEILSNGQVTPQTGSNAYFSLDISFIAEQ